VDDQYIVLILLAVGIALLAYLIVQRGLSELLSRMVSVSGGTVFYRRAFLLMLLFGALGSAVSANFKAEPGMHFMERVWAIAGALENVFGYTFLTLGIYLILITILVAALKPKDDK
jgi:hypothetical protein